MPNFASTLKQEISRLARKEVNSQLQVLRKASVQHRKQITALKKESVQLKTHSARLAKAPSTADLVSSVGEEETQARFSPKSVMSQRKRLGLSAADYGKLAGVTGATIYAWEQGRSRPRASQLQVLGQLRGIGKTQANQRLSETATPGKAKSAKRTVKSRTKK